MARPGTSILDSGEPLPVLGMDTVAHGQLALPDAFGDGWGVSLLYRALGDGWKLTDPQWAGPNEARAR